MTVNAWWPATILWLDWRLVWSWGLGASPETWIGGVRRGGRGGSEWEKKRRTEVEEEGVRAEGVEKNLHDYYKKNFKIILINKYIISFQNKKK